MISRMLLRNACVQALTEKETDGSFPTFAGENVFDSKIFPNELSELQQQVPLIAVYTDTQQFDEDRPRSDDAVIDNIVHKVDLCIDMAIAESAQVKDEQGNLVPQTALVQTDDELEALLDIMEAQVFWTLQNPGKHWSQVFGMLVRGYTSYKSEREADGKGNNRMAFRAIKLGTMLCPDPRPRVIPANVTSPMPQRIAGIPVTGTYLDVMLAQMASDMTQVTQMNLTTALELMRSTFGVGGGILMPALQRIGYRATLDDAAMPDGKMTVASGVMKMG